MNYQSDAKSRRFAAGVLAFFLMLALSSLLAGAASAASIDCGQCHGSVFNNASTGSSGSISYDARGGAVPGYESKLLPMVDNDRGLHGIHMNYSSASYPTGAGQVRDDRAEIHGPERSGSQRRYV